MKHMIYQNGEYVNLQTALHYLNDSKQTEKYKANAIYIKQMELFLGRYLMISYSRQNQFS